MAADRAFRQVAFPIALLATALVAFTTVGAFADEVDTVAIARDFTALPRNHLVVLPVPQPPKGADKEGKEGKSEIAANLGEIMTEELVASLKLALPESQVAAADAAASGSDRPDGLVLKAWFSRLVPGSRAKRFWVGFGAGKSVTEITGEVKDIATDRVVARFTHAKLSWCCGYGSNDDEIRANLKLAATDIAALVAGKLDKHQAHTWLPDDPNVVAPSQPEPEKAPRP